MNSIILAAGSGNRLRPLTDEIPKCLVEIAGKSLLSWQIDALIKAGVHSINIVVGHKYNKIISLKDSRINRYFFNKNYFKNNMVKSLLLAKDLFSSGLLISYSDIVYSSKIALLILKSNYKNAIIVDLDWFKLWSKRFKNPLDDAETLRFDKNFNLIDIGQKAIKQEEIMAQYIGLMKFENKTLKFIQNLALNNKIDDHMFMTDLIRILLDNDIKIKVIPIKRGWIEVDSLDDLKLYQNAIIKQKKVDIFSIFN